MRVTHLLQAALFAAVSTGATMAYGFDTPEFRDRFDQLNPSDWSVANYDFSHPHFDTDWRPTNLELLDGLKLSLIPHDAGLNRFSGASLRRHTASHFGWYEATLTAARGDGVVTGFFLYTGPSYGTQHDEIDWEFFGQDTSVAQVAWFQNGVIRSQRIPLGFDAADGPNAYAINWQPDRLSWYVNGTEVFSTTEAIPQTPQHLFMNIWAVSPTPELQAWAGLADPGKVSSATVHEVTQSPGIPDKIARN